jgi:hypothetical protein
MIIGLLPIVLDKDRAPHLESFLEFLSQSNHSRITLDQWDSFLQFNHNVKYDLSNLEEDGACKGSLRVLPGSPLLTFRLCLLLLGPLLLDEYVEWRKKSNRLSG